VSHRLLVEPNRPLPDVIREVRTTAALQPAWRRETFMTERFGSGDSESAVTACVKNLFTTERLWIHMAVSEFLSVGRPTASEMNDIGRGLFAALTRFID
jgi:hypothetical protein